MTFKIFFLSILLAVILSLALKMNSPVFVMAVFFLPASFLASLSVGSQSFTLARLPFLFLNGVVIFFLFFKYNLSDAEIVFISLFAFILVFLATNYFASHYKALPNISGEEQETFVLKYEASRDVIFAFLFLTAFIWYVNAFVFYSIFGYPFFLALLIIFFVTFLLTSFAVRVYAAPRKDNKNSALPAIYSWVIGLVMVQASWVVGFWPFGYLTAAVIITIIYYVTLVSVKEYFFGRMETQRVVKEFLFGMAVVIVIFYFTEWLPA